MSRERGERFNPARHESQGRIPWSLVGSSGTLGLVAFPFGVDREGAHADAAHSETGQQIEGGDEKYSARNWGTGN